MTEGQPRGVSKDSRGFVKIHVSIRQTRPAEPLLRWFSLKLSVREPLELMVEPHCGTSGASWDRNAASHELPAPGRRQAEGGGAEWDEF